MTGGGGYVFRTFCPTIAPVRVLTLSSENMFCSKNYLYSLCSMAYFHRLGLLWWQLSKDLMTRLARAQQLNRGGHCWDFWRVRQEPEGRLPSTTTPQQNQILKFGTCAVLTFFDILPNNYEQVKYWPFLLMADSMWIRLDGMDGSLGGVKYRTPHGANKPLARNLEF